jgi:Fe-coproporphyrin III synthase
MRGPTGSTRVIQIHPTLRCNLFCAHCYSSSGPASHTELDREIVLGLVKDAAQLGYNVVGISGGEPLLYRPLPDVLGEARRQGLATTVTTNGMMLT